MPDLIDRLPPVRGRLTPNRPLSDLSWLRVGGPAEVLFQPADMDDLTDFLKALPADVPVFPVGVCSNLIIRDGGIRGVVIRLGRGFNGFDIKGDTVRVGAAALDAQVAKRAAEAGVDLAFLRTIPGSIGGAVRMNAGCYGRYTADVVTEVTAVTRAGDVLRLSPEDLGFSYRSTRLPADTLIVEAVLRGALRPPEDIEATMQDALDKREASQPVRDRSCGSTFRNPAGFSSTGRDDDVHDLKAWKLIDAAGLRGERWGGARISPKHSNFLINEGGASATDLEELGEKVRETVLKNSGIELEWEIMRVGEPLKPEAPSEE